MRSAAAAVFLTAILWPFAAAAQDGGASQPAAAPAAHNAGGTAAVESNPSPAAPASGSGAETVQEPQIPGQSPEDGIPEMIHQPSPPIAKPESVPAPPPVKPESAPAPAPAKPESAPAPAPVKPESAPAAPKSPAPAPAGPGSKAEPAESKTGCARAFSPLVDGYKRAYDEMAQWLRDVDAKTSKAEARVSQLQELIKKDEAEITSLRLAGDPASRERLKGLSAETDQAWRDLREARREKDRLCGEFSRDAAQRVRGYAEDIQSRLRDVQSRLR